MGSPSSPGSWPAPATRTGAGGSGTAATRRPSMPSARPPPGHRESESSGPTGCATPIGRTWPTPPASRPAPVTCGCWRTSATAGPAAGGSTSSKRSLPSTCRRPRRLPPPPTTTTTTTTATTPPGGEVPAEVTTTTTTAPPVTTTTTYVPPPPPPPPPPPANLVGVYQWAYPDEQVNTETMFFFDGRLVVVTKTEPSRVYRFDEPLLRSGLNVPTYVGTLPSGKLSVDRRPVGRPAHPGRLQPRQGRRLREPRRRPRPGGAHLQPRLPPGHGQRQP